MALNLVAYGASDDESDDAMDETPGSAAVVINKPIVSSRQQSLALGATSEAGDIPKPSKKELELAELAKKEKANLFSRSTDLSHVTQKKGGRIVIGIPSLTEVHHYLHLYSMLQINYVL